MSEFYEEIENVQETERCTYCGAMQVEGSVPRACNGDCGENPQEFNDMSYNEELKF